MIDKQMKLLNSPDFDKPRLQNKLKGDLEILPLRTLDDFLLASAKFQIPDYRNPKRLWHRVYNNLFYYQTNYFFTGLFIFIYFLFMYTSKIIYGIMLTTHIIKLIPWLRNPWLRGSFKVPEFIGLCIGVLILRYFEFSITYAVSCLMLFWTSILTIIFVTFVHASLRLRNFSNKMVNFLDFGEKRTPMTVLLHTCLSYLNKQIIDIIRL